METGIYSGVAGTVPQVHSDYINEQARLNDVVTSINGCIYGYRAFTRFA
jgi:hypothetical protein